MACIRKRRGRYVIDFYDQLGVRRWKTMPEGATREEAEEEWIEIRKSVKSKSYISEKKTPLFPKVAQDWLDYKKPKLRVTSWEVREGHLKNHFKDLDGLKINQITTPFIEKFIARKQEQEMNINTLRKVLGTLNQILSYAVRHKYLDHNPLRDAERPRDPGEDKKEIQVLTPEQIRAFLEDVEDRKYKTLFLMAIMTGARQGELLGLEWGDLDLEKNQVYIQRTFNNGRFFPTKTKGSKRKIDLSPTVMHELKIWKLACPKTDLDLMFPNDAGGPIDKNNMMKRYFEPALEKAGIITRDKRTKKIEGPPVRFHDLRHTYASLLLEQGENIKYVQTMLGHSTPMVTLNVYSHLMKPVNQEAVCRLENTIFETTGSKMVAETKKELTPKGITP